jgi:hypothetical protein
MNRARALIVSFAVAVAAIAGVFALTSTVSLSSQKRASTDRQVATRTAQLNRYEASLRKALAQKPPKLPAIPAAGIQSAGAQSPAPVAAPSTSARVVYHRPPPIVVVKHRAGSGDGAENEQGRGFDD